MTFSMSEATPQQNQKEGNVERGSDASVESVPPPPLPIQVPEETQPTASALVAALKKEYQPVKWKRLNPVFKVHGGAVPPRQGHRAVAYKNLMIIFSGGNEGLFEDLNVYNTITNEWTQPNVKGHIPPGKAAYGAAIDGHRILVFGGMEEGGEFSDSLFELNVQKWEWTLLRPEARSPEARPCARIGHSFTLIKDKIYMFGGLANQCNLQGRVLPIYLNDLHVLHSRANRQHGNWDMPTTFGKTPSPRESHTAVAYVSKDSRHNKLVIYGGMVGKRLGDLHSLDVDTMMWSQIKTKSPLPRSLHTATLVGEKVYIFGGWVPVSPYSDRGKCDEQESTDIPWVVSNQLNCLNVRTMNWENVRHVGEGDDAETPGARAGHSAVTINNRIYMWSGRDGFKRSRDGKQVCAGDLWMLDVEKPGVPGKVVLYFARHDSLVLGWTPVPGADGYILQCMIFEMQEDEVPPCPTPTKVVPSPKPAPIPHQVGPVQGQVAMMPPQQMQMGTYPVPPFMRPRMTPPANPMIPRPMGPGPFQFVNSAQVTQQQMELFKSLTTTTFPQQARHAGVGPPMRTQSLLRGPMLQARPPAVHPITAPPMPTRSVAPQFNFVVMRQQTPLPCMDVTDVMRSFLAYQSQQCLPTSQQQIQGVSGPSTQPPPPSTMIQNTGIPANSQQQPVPMPMVRSVGPTLRLVNPNPMPQGIQRAVHPQFPGQMMPFVQGQQQQQQPGSLAQRPRNYVRILTPGQSHVRQQAPQRLTLTGHGIPGTPSMSQQHQLQQSSSMYTGGQNAQTPGPR